MGNKVGNEMFLKEEIQLIYSNYNCIKSKS